MRRRVENRSYHPTRLPSTFKPLKWVITGTPCSGTNYVAEMLTRAGMPTAHEMRYKPENWMENAPFEGESSSFAPIYLEKKTHVYSKPPVVVHLIRPPLNTIACMRAKKIHRIPVFQAMMEGENLNAYGVLWAMWNSIIMEKIDLRWRIGKIRPSDVANLARHVGYPLESLKARRAMRETPITGRSDDPVMPRIDEFSGPVADLIDSVRESLNLPMSEAGIHA
jgi:hypothetical protein